MSVPLFVTPEAPSLDLGELGRDPTPDGGSVETCDVCGEVITGTLASGRGNARFKLGTHRWVKHHIKSDKSKKPRAGGKAALDPEDYVSQPISTAMREIADSVGDNRRVPTANDLAKGLGKGLALATVGASVYAVETDRAIPEGPQGQEVRNYLIGYLSLKEKAATDVMSPIARMLAPTSLNKKYGRQIVDNVDVVASFSELGAMAMHWRTYLRERSRMAAVLATPPGGIPPAANLPGGNVAAAGLSLVPDLGQPVPPMPGMDQSTATPPPMSGVVITGPPPA